MWQDAAQGWNNKDKVEGSSNVTPMQKEMWVF